jgi:hypothetical protein
MKTSDHRRLFLALACLAAFGCGGLGAQIKGDKNRHSDDEASAPSSSGEDGKSEELPMPADQPGNIAGSYLVECRRAPDQDLADQMIVVRCNVHDVAGTAVAPTSLATTKLSAEVLTQAGATPVSIELDLNDLANPIKVLVPTALIESSTLLSVHAGGYGSTYTALVLDSGFILKEPIETAPGKKDGDVSLTFNVQTTLLANASRVVLRRTSGTTVPDCSAVGETIGASSSVETFSGGAVVVDRSGLPGGTFSYRLCALNAKGVDLDLNLVVIAAKAAGTYKHTIFVTAEVWTGDLGGVSGADEKCQTAAAGVSLRGKFLALLSVEKGAAGSNGVNAITRVPIRGIIQDTNGKVIAESAADWWDNSSPTLLNVTEQRTPVSSSHQVWTGTTIQGYATGKSCGGWFDSAASAIGTFGSIRASEYVGSGDDDCSVLRHLYCISE